MKCGCIAIAFLTVSILTIASDAKTTSKPSGASERLGFRRCHTHQDGQERCRCGKSWVMVDPLRGARCVRGQVLGKTSTNSSTSSTFRGLRTAAVPLRQSTREQHFGGQCGTLQILQRRPDSNGTHVPLRHVSVVASINMFAADVTLTQVFVNREENPIEAIYVFPIEENAAIYSFTAKIGNRTIAAMLKEKKTAEQEYTEALSQGQTAVMIRQSAATFDTFTINVGALSPGNECQITIRYVTELELIDKNSIRFVVPTTIAPRYNPSLGHLQSPDNTQAEYVQNTPYSMSFEAHILHSEEYKISHVANLSHPVNLSLSTRSIDVTADNLVLDRDIILDIDLSQNRPTALMATEKYSDAQKYAVLLAFTPSLSDFMKLSERQEENNNEFIFIVDCSGSMSSSDQIGLAKKAMLLFVRSLPVGSHFNIIRFGSNFDVLFKGELLTTVYNETTAKIAETLTRSMDADFGGTELLEPLKYLQERPPIRGRSRQIFLLTDGEISNTNQVIDLCRTMSSTTRIFSFGLGSSPSRALVKGLARATNGYFVFVPPDSQVDTYVASQFGRALQPSLVNAQLEWQGLSTNVSQSPKTIPPLYVNDRVLVYALLDWNDFRGAKNVTVALRVGNHRISTTKIAYQVATHGDVLRRLAAKALIQELQHQKENTSSNLTATREQSITQLSLAHQILSPFTAFIGVETIKSQTGNARTEVRHVPIQISSRTEPLPSNTIPSSMSGMGFAYARHHHGFQSLRGSSGTRPVAFAAQFRATTTRSPNSAFPAQSRIGDLSDEDADRSFDGRSPAKKFDPVRWLIDHQSFNGAWVFSDQDLLKLTNQKPFDSFTSTASQAKEALHTALAIAVLESQHADQKTLWNAIAQKGRKQLQSSGLTVEQVNKLVDDIKNQL